MQLSIITINYNKSDLTLSCLKSLYLQYNKELNENIFEVILVDNASRLSDWNRLEQKIKLKNYKNLKIVKNKSNVGFSKGCNIGAQKADGDMFLFLNNDTEIKDRGLVGMIDFLVKNDQVQVLGGKLMNPDQSEQVSVGKFYTLVNAFLLLIGLQRLGFVNNNPTKTSKVDWVKGGCLMVRKKVFESLSGFDENLFMYIEDMEFCYRAKSAGYKVFFFPHVTIVHVDQGSSDRAFAIVNIYQNLLYFYKKHRSRKEYLFLKTVLYAKALILIALGKITNSKYLISTYEKALKVA